MIPRILVTTALLTTISFVAPAKAEDLAQTEPQSLKLSSDQILAACASDQAQTLLSPYPDVPQNHWAYQAVLSMYYCGAYRGQALPRSQQLQEQPLQRN